MKNRRSYAVHPARLRALQVFAAALLILALPLPLLFAQELNPALVSSSSVILEENGSVAVSPGVFYSLSMNLSVPSNLPYQKVQSAQEPRKDANGNSYFLITAKGPNDFFSYSRQIAVQVLARETASLPENYSTPAEYSKYLPPTARTQSADPEIKKYAAAATEGAKTPFEKVARLAMFTNSLITYDESVVGQKKDARWVLDNRRGVCVEYATLFVALARASGIPARYVAGYAYSEKFNGWLGHAWAEAYVGEWVPVDPTWFEAGSLDALHIESGKYPEYANEQNLAATVSSQYSKLKWLTSNSGGAAANNIATVQIQSDSPNGNYSLSISEPEIKPAGTSAISLSLAGNDYRVIPVTLSTCTGVSSVTVANPGQYAILSPGKTSTISWNITAPSPSALDSRYTYDCPLTVNSPYLAVKAISVKINPRAGQGSGAANGATDKGDAANSGTNGAQNTGDGSNPPIAQSGGDSSQQQSGGSPSPCFLVSLVFMAAILIVFARN